MRKPMNIQQATKSYEQWMRQRTTVVESDLRSKHEQMKKDALLFLRGTFYRWAQQFPEICPELARAPQVLASGDVHVGSFGTWRDEEGRLCWGIDDFDEAYPLPYTNDLVRLATSVKIAIDAGELRVKLKDGCDAILEGYRETSRQGGCPMVLAEHEKNLKKLGIAATKPADDFWEKLNDRPTVSAGFPKNAKLAMEKTLPDARLKYKVVRRKAGMGSLGQQRFVAIANWKGGFICREAKAMVPSACVWLKGQAKGTQNCYQKIIESAVRSRDPYQKMIGPWLIRRLSPDSNPIDISDLPKERVEETLLHAMGSEVANIHLGSRQRIRTRVQDLNHRQGDWLRAAAKAMARTVEKDWEHYRR
jgi:Uncharacterized protein conserved in bacteria (DUF2252)